MTNEEAINELLFAKRDTITNSARDEALDKAIEALKKQIPKKVVFEKDFYGGHFSCPKSKPNWWETS